jgi:hypothetical protein
MRMQRSFCISSSTCSGVNGESESGSLGGNRIPIIYLHCSLHSFSLLGGLGAFMFMTMERIWNAMWILEGHEVTDVLRSQQLTPLCHCESCFTRLVLRLQYHFQHSALVRLAVYVHDVS